MKYFRTLPHAAALAVCALFALPAAAFAQNSDPKDVTVQVNHKDKTVQAEEEKWWFLTLEAGYSSRYMFRGTELTPNSDGIAFEEMRFSAKGFTIGIWAAQQIGTTIVEHNTATGESGGGGNGGGLTAVDFGLPPGSPLSFDDTAIQRSFREIDLYFSYYHSFGWIDVTVGNIAFFVDRQQIDRFDVFFNGTLIFTQDFPSIGDETFDRLFLTLSTHKIPYIVPSLTYYQTIYNDGFTPGIDILYFDRNDELGGYLEAKLSASIPLVKDRLSLEPTAIISYSFDDRMEATGTFPTAVPLTGFNHFQIGTELVWRVNNCLSIHGFGNFAHHFPAPTGGTKENTFWGGGKVSLNF